MTTFSQWRRGEVGADTQDLAVPEDARVFQGERAGFTTRLLACIIDVALVALLMFGILLSIEIVQLLFSPGLDIQPPRLGTLIVWGYLITTLYWTVSWASSGRSFGAWVLGVRVVNPRGGRLRLPYALLRAAFCVAFPFGLLWAVVSKRNRSVQDVVLRTIVIYDWSPRAPLIIGAWRQK